MIQACGYLDFGHIHGYNTKGRTCPWRTCCPASTAVYMT